MSEENKTKIEEAREGQISRRHFLKDAGLVIGAPTIGSIAVSSEVMAQAKANSATPGARNRSRTNRHRI